MAWQNTSNLWLSSRPAVRLGLIGAAGYVFYVALLASSQSDVLRYPWLTAIQLLLYPLGLLLLFCATLRHSVHFSHTLILVAVLLGVGGEYFLRSGLPVRGSTSTTDGMLYSQFGAELLRRGENPYAVDMCVAFQVFNVRSHLDTVEVDGSPVCRAENPALFYLVPLVPILLGIPYWGAATALAHLLTLLTLFWFAPGHLRSLVPLALLLNPGLVNPTLPDMVWALLMVVVVIAWDKPWRAGLVYGLACAFKPIPWFLAPFLLARVYLEAQPNTRWRKLISFGGAASISFLIPNLAFMLADLPAWLQAVTGNANDHVMLGQGLSMLTEFNVLQLPKNFYTLATLTALGILLLMYIRHFARLRDTVWIYASIVLWFYYRSLDNYYIYWIPVLIAAILSIARAKAIDENGIRESWLRLGLVGVAGFAFFVGQQILLIESPVQQPYQIPLVMIAYLSGLGLALWSTIEPLPRWSIRVVASGAVLPLLLLAFGQLILQTPSATVLMTDDAMYTQIGAALLTRGLNPYSLDLAGAMSVFNSLPRYTTSYTNGSLVGHATYPALHYLLFEPLAAIGLNDVRFLMILLQIAAILLLLWKSPPRLRPLVAMAVITNIWLFFNALGFVTDIAWIFLLIGMVFLWNKPVHAGILFGLACAFKPTPWFLAPFLITRLLLETPVGARARALLRFGGPAVLVFSALNLPFFLASPLDWIQVSLAPALGNLVIYGQGLAALTQNGVLDLGKSSYSLAAIGIMLVLIIAYVRHFAILKQTLWVFPGVVLWFSYRSLDSYFSFWPLVAVAAVISAPRVETHAGQASRSWRLPRLVPSTAILIGLWALVVSGLMLFYALQPSPLQVQLAAPLGVGPQGRVNLIQVQLLNRTRSTVNPRFFVQFGSLQSFPWNIVDGPHQLAPGMSGLYTLSMNLPDEMIPPTEPFQVIANDAQNGYTVRTSATFKGDDGLADARQIDNPAFRYWNAAEDHPYGWGSIRQLGSGDRASFYHVPASEDTWHAGLSLEQQDVRGNWSRVMLDQWIENPDGDIGLWVRPTQSYISGLPDYGYGVEIFDGRHTLWILYADKAASGFFSASHAFSMVAVPLNQWSYQTINIRAEYQRAGWSLPEPMQVVRDGVEKYVPMLNFRLMVASRRTNPATYNEQIGPIIAPPPASVQKNIDDYLNDPAGALVRVGDQRFGERNYPQAVQAYQQATKIAPSHGAAYFGLGESYFWLGQYERAIGAYAQSAQLGYRVAEAYRGMGWSWLTIGDVKRAESNFRLAIQTNPLLPDAYNGLGWSLAQQNQCAGAVSNFKQALQLAPNLPQPQRGLEQCQQSAGNPP